ncbi:hypothetical protein [Lacticaseibacillus saniviri]|uniref:Uncharacterized protein n=1 Tax=Lacticaseibacillus saniviri JCM 17471 = DSM 24301 TaxID=1293598 RepID=A0A0R2MN50_9LACO|nr:hypothetical protein [Lacticaseibacillus saniviri]KRO15111.1 hypothetical protein IV56_GL000199 [Lacticaseibacillus saniviri JCM 17471 = DSM 24301]
MDKVGGITLDDMKINALLRTVDLILNDNPVDGSAQPQVVEPELIDELELKKYAAQLRDKRDVTTYENLLVRMNRLLPLFYDATSHLLHGCLDIAVAGEGIAALWKDKSYEVKESRELADKLNTALKGFISRSENRGTWVAHYTVDQAVADYYTCRDRIYTGDIASQTREVANHVHEKVMAMNVALSPTDILSQLQMTLRMNNPLEQMRLSAKICLQIPA